MSENEVTVDIEMVLRQMCLGRSRYWSENMVNIILKTNVIQDKCIEDNQVADEDMIVTALMEYVYGCI
jgi:hypothetical protein